MFAPAIHLVQQSLALHADVGAQTPQQKEFATKTLPALRQAAAAFCKPTDHIVMHPELAWTPFKAVLRSLAQQLRYVSTVSCGKDCWLFHKVHITHVAGLEHAYSKLD